MLQASLLGAIFGTLARFRVAYGLDGNAGSRFQADKHKRVIRENGLKARLNRP